MTSVSALIVGVGAGLRRRFVTVEMPEADLPAVRTFDFHDGEAGRVDDDGLGATSDAPQGAGHIDFKLHWGGPNLSHAEPAHGRQDWVTRSFCLRSRSVQRRILDGNLIGRRGAMRFEISVVNKRCGVPSPSCQKPLCDVGVPVEELVFLHVGQLDQAMASLAPEPAEREKPATTLDERMAALRARKGKIGIQ